MVFPIFLKFRRVNIDHRLPRAARHVFRGVAHNRQIHARADGQQKIAILQGKIRAPRGDRARPSDEQRIGVANQVHGDPGGFDRDVEEPQRLFQQRFGPGQPDTVADHEQGPLSAVQHVDDFAHLLR